MAFQPLEPRAPGFLFHSRWCRTDVGTAVVTLQWKWKREGDGKWREKAPCAVAGNNCLRLGLRIVEKRLEFANALAVPIFSLPRCPGSCVFFVFCFCFFLRQVL